jgi:Ca-activated chloride channel family protein
VTAPHLAHPEWAPFVAASLIGVAVATTLSWLLARRRARRLLGDARAMPPARLGADLLLVAAIAAIGLAWLGLKLGTRVVRVPGSGVDLVVLFDTSRSMDATDVPPSRIARARELTREVLARLGGEDRAALAVFASRGVVLSPLTPDTDALAELAAALDTELVRPSGSDLGAGVAAAVTAFEAGSTRPRVLLVLSDGEDPEARADAGSAVARRADTRVVAVAFGGEAGASIPAGDVTLADERGRPVQTRRDVARLAELADATGGIAFAADRWGEVDLAGLLAELRRDGAQASGGLVERRVPATQVVPLALFAFVLLALEWIGGPRALCAALRRRRALALGAAGALALATAAIAAQDDAVAWLEARLRERPGDARLLVALGVARAERGDLDEASHALRAAAVGARDPRDAALAYYDLGVLELERRRFDAARDAFLDALALAPDDAEARFNLEWSLRALAAQPESDAQRADDDAREEAERPDPELPDPNAAPGAREGDAKDEPPPPEGEQPRPVANPEAARRFAPELAPDRVQQWLDAVHDDPGRGLRDAARDAADARTRRAERPRW